MASKKICFFVAPIGDEGTEVRKRSDQVTKYVVEPPAGQAGYEVIRADRIERPGIITSQVIEHVLEAELVIADLTGRNPNVFYELALRHAVRKPYIQLIHQGELIPFDVAGVRTIAFDYRDLDSVEKCKKDILGHIHALETDRAEVESPVTVAIETQSLRKSGQPVEHYLAEIRESLSQLGEKADKVLREMAELGNSMGRTSWELPTNVIVGSPPVFYGSLSPTYARALPGVEAKDVLVQAEHLKGTAAAAEGGHRRAHQGKPEKKEES